MCKCRPEVRTPCCGRPGCCCPRCWKPTHAGMCTGQVHVEATVPGSALANELGPTVYVVDAPGAVPQALIDKLLDEPRQTQACPRCGQHHLSSNPGFCPEVTLDEPAATAPCLHRYVRPEIPTAVLSKLPMQPGEATREYLTRCVDCGQPLGVKVTVTIELVPVS